MKEAKKNFMHTILHVSFKLLSLGNLGSRRKIYKIHKVGFLDGNIETTVA